MVKCDSSLQRTHFHCSRVQWQWALHHSSRRLALRIVIFGLCATQPWKPISWSSRQTAIVLMLIPEAVWNLVVSVATEDRQFIRATWFSTLRSRSVSLCGLPLRGWAVVAPRHVHFIITALNRAALVGKKFDELTCWKGGILWQCHTKSHWALQNGPFYCQCLSMEIEFLCARFYTPVSNTCGWHGWIH
jgi:hypothetical protein